MFSKNSWYVGARSSEVGNAPLGRTVCNEDVVFFRGADGRIAAVEDFCPHRGARLSLGYVKDGALICGYHGLQMASNGKTVSMPCQRVGGFPAIRTFPVLERYGFIWIWPGAAEHADETKIPVLDWASDPEWAYCGGLYHVNCDYRLMIDNVMDLTHESYLHPSSLGQKEIEESSPKSRTEGDCAITERYMEGVYAPPFWRQALRGNGLDDDVLVDRWQVCRFYAPSHVFIDVGVAHAGKGGISADSASKVSSIVVNFITPESDESMWYFWGMARNFSPNDLALSEQIENSLSKVFSEDLHMLETQHLNLAKNKARQLLNLNIDGGGVGARKLIIRSLDANN